MRRGEDRPNFEYLLSRYTNIRESLLSRGDNTEVGDFFSSLTSARNEVMNKVLHHITNEVLERLRRLSRSEKRKLSRKSMYFLTEIAGEDVSLSATLTGIIFEIDEAFAFEPVERLNLIRKAETSYRAARRTLEAKRMKAMLFELECREAIQDPHRFPEALALSSELINLTMNESDRVMISFHSYGNGLNHDAKGETYLYEYFDRTRGDPVQLREAATEYRKAATCYNSAKHHSDADKDAQWCERKANMAMFLADPEANPLPEGVLDDEAVGLIDASKGSRAAFRKNLFGRVWDLQEKFLDSLGGTLATTAFHQLKDFETWLNNLVNEIHALDYWIVGKGRHGPGLEERRLVKQISSEVKFCFHDVYSHVKHGLSPDEIILDESAKRNAVALRRFIERLPNKIEKMKTEIWGNLHP